MGLKSKLFGLGAALTLGLTLVAPAAASVGTQQVSVSVTEGGLGVATIGVTATGGGSFGIVPLNAAESSTDNTGGANGLKTAGTVVLSIAVSSLNHVLYSNAFDYTVKLTGGTGTNPALVPSVAVPAFENSSGTNFEIPGRYLGITSVGNPAQQKFTGGNSCGNVWVGGLSGCAPRDADFTANKPIYKVADSVGQLGSVQYTSGTCRATSGSITPATPTCGTGLFDSPNSILVMHTAPGSGSLITTANVTLGLNVPAGLYPTTYSGTITVDQQTI